MTRIIELIYTDRFTGDGTKESPFRYCPELWSKDGRLVAAIDNGGPNPGSFFNPVNIEPQ
jgi:hypothetical protein